MNTKNMSFCQVCWDHELSQYHFQMNYYHEKANIVADALF